MQTFLPYPSFSHSAKVLDYRRLGKQRVEAKQILNALRKGGAWSRHPATLMWRGYEHALTAYMNAMINEWVARGYNNTMRLLKVPKHHPLPPWVGKRKFHSRHRSALLYKDFGFYSQYNWREEPVLDYWWPTKETS